ncbi:MAG: hypothetical protein E6J91_33650 [Deltaproteobacteria bacterium]|nr:MAG: hypothetical protein E6J91_33650 [Deltaproteobacteria bacterium]
MADTSRFPLELPCRLSKSVLWRLQRRFYERQGMAAWSDGVVPHQVTSNPYMARAYLYIVELGAGTGRLAFQFLRHFDRLLAGSPFRDLAFRYVMTDVAEPNLAAWRAHPLLAPWLASGRLDLARFDAARDDAIALEHGGATLAPGTVHNPVVVIANYVLDSLPLDGFSVKDGRLHEWRVRLCSTHPDTDLDDPDVLSRARLAVELCPLPPGAYGDAELDRILDEYRGLSDTAFTFPSASLACLSRLSRLAGGRLLVLSTDKGDAREDALRAPTGTNLTLHGSFSISVNYHAVARFVHHRGGEALTCPDRPHAITTCAFVLGPPPGGAVETRAAYAEAIDAQRPDDLFSLQQAMERGHGELSLDHWIAYLRFTDHDPKLLADAVPFLTSLIGGATGAQRDELLRVLVRTWDGYFPIGEPDDLGGALGALASAMAAWPEAIGFLEGSLRWHGRQARTLLALARCRRELGHAEAARELVDEAVAIDPTCEVAIALG